MIPVACLAGWPLIQLLKNSLYLEIWQAVDSDVLEDWTCMQGKKTVLVKQYMQVWYFFTSSVRKEKVMVTCLHISSLHLTQEFLLWCYLEICLECGADHSHGTLHKILVGDPSSMSVLVFISGIVLFSLNTFGFLSVPFHSHTMVTSSLHLWKTWRIVSSSPVSIWVIVHDLQNCRSSR